MIHSLEMEPDMKGLFEVLEIQPTNDFVKVAQEKWFQKNKERWEFQERFADKRSTALPYLTRLGYVNERRATKMKYDYALVFGGWQERVEGRLNMLVSEWKRGVRFQTLVFLTGKRFLDKNTEPLATTCPTETEMMQHIFFNMDVPEELKKLPIVIINTPQPKKGQRPNTEDTIKLWILTHPKPGSCLAVSTQPFMKYQDSNLKTLLSDDFSVETIANKAKDNTLLSVYLDSVARFLYQEQIRLK